MKKIIIVLFFPGLIFSQVGINIDQPTNTFHIKGDGATDPLRIEGLQEKSTENKILYVDDNGVVKKGAVNPINNTSIGAIYANHYLQGTAPLTINSTNSADIPGVNITITVPNTVQSQTFFITVNGYISSPNGTAAQGVFELWQNDTKISSSYASISDFSGQLINLPVPATLIKSIVLNPGVYTLKVVYNSWTGKVIVNRDPNNYLGYNQDSEAMLTKMSILVFNN